MKRLFRIGSGMFVFSIIPILSWIVLSRILGDTRISNVFSITYAMQFIYAILRYFFGSGANIRKAKEGTANSVWNSIFWGVIFSVIIFAIPLIFVDKYIAFFGQDVEFYRIYVIYSIALLFLQTLFSFIIEKLYFEDKERVANAHMFAYNIATFTVLIVSTSLIDNTLIALIITLSVLVVYVVCLYVWQFERFKIEFNFFKNFKYDSANIITSLFMFVIFLFGYQTAFTAGADYLVAVNIVNLCTDTQWDIMDAVSTVAKVDIAKNRYDYHKEVKNAYIYTCILISSSIAMTVGLTFANGAVFSLTLSFLAFEIAGFVLYPYKNILSIYTQLEYSAILNTSINFVAICIRTLLSIVIISPYCTAIGQIVQGALTFVAFVIIRLSRYQSVDGRLTVKTTLT